jgi:hypothetical protein
VPKGKWTAPLPLEDKKNPPSWRMNVAIWSDARIIWLALKQGIVIRTPVASISFFGLTRCVGT